MKQTKSLAGFELTVVRDKCFQVNHPNHSATDATFVLCQRTCLIGRSEQFQHKRSLEILIVNEILDNKNDDAMEDSLIL